MKNNDKFLFVEKVFVLIFVFALTFSCEKANKNEAEIYKKNAKSLNKLLTKYFRLDFNPRTRPFSEKKIISVEFDVERRDAFLKSTEDRWFELSNRLKEFEIEYPNSLWADDAAFCRALEFAFIRTPIPRFVAEKENAIRDFLNGHEKFEIEKWTEKTFSSTYKVFFNGLPLEIRGELTDAEAIRGGLHVLLISHLISKGFLEETKKEIVNLKNKGINSFFIQTSKKLLKRANS